MKSELHLHEVVSVKAAALKALQDQLLTAIINPENNELFRSCVSSAIDINLVGERQIARRFDVPRTSVRRWANGNNAPFPGMRHHVYEWLYEQTDKILVVIEQYQKETINGNEDV